MSQLNGSYEILRIHEYLEEKLTLLREVIKMKKKWTNPTLQVLDVKMTMWNLEGSHHDGAWTEHLPNPVDPDGNGLPTESQMS